MRIDISAFTPMQIQQNLQIQKTGSAAFESAISSTSVTESPVQNTHTSARSSDIVSTQQTEESTSAMSKYLNTEEKQMLNMLFPPAGRQVGVQAYRAVQTPVRNPAVLGQNLDITS